MAWDPTTEELLTNPRLRRADAFEFELVDARNRHGGWLHPDMERPPTVTWDTTRDVHRSLDSFHLTSDEASDVNELTDRVRVWLRLQNGDRWSLGVFMWADETTFRRPWGRESDGKLLDKSHILTHPRLPSSSLGRGRLVLDLAVKLVRKYPEFAADYELPANWRRAEAAELKWVRDVIAYVGDDEAGRILGSPVTWARGVPALRRLNDLMALVAYLPVHLDRDGTLIMRSAPELRSTTVPDLRYSETNGSIITDSLSESTKRLSAPNAVFVTGVSGNDTPITGTWFAPASAPWSKENRDGVIAAEHHSPSGLLTNKQARRMARAIGEWSAKGGDWWEFSSTIDPRHDGYNILEVEGNMGIEVSWKAVCRTGDPMTHRVRRVYQDDPEQLGWPT